MGVVQDVLKADVVLGEGSIYERLRRHSEIEYDPFVAHAGLIYHEDYARHLDDVHRQYIAVAKRAGLPMLVTAGTARANAERLSRSAFARLPVNQDHVRFVREICREEQTETTPLLLGGVLAPRGDAYRPEEGLPVDEAERFHSFQVGALEEGGVDVLLAMTLPALPEALGLARAMQASQLPYFLSFVVRDSGVLLDGTPLDEAIDRIDQQSTRAPTGYWINCVHPSICRAALDVTRATARERIVGFKANTSALRPEELDGSAELLTEAPELLAPQIDAVRRDHSLRFVAGCCGTGTEHLEHLAKGIGTHG